jgi:hypothetical protein
VELAIHFRLKPKLRLLKNLFSIYPVRLYGLVLKQKEMLLFIRRVYNCNLGHGMAQSI